MKNKQEFTDLQKKLSWLTVGPNSLKVSKKEILLMKIISMAAKLPSHHLRDTSSSNLCNCQTPVQVHSSHSQMD